MARGRRALLASRYACNRIEYYGEPRIELDIGFEPGSNWDSQYDASHAAAERMRDGIRTLYLRSVVPRPGTVFSVDWGDGTVQSGLTVPPQDPHKYTGDGPYRIVIRGDFISISGRVDPDYIYLALVSPYAQAYGVGFNKVYAMRCDRIAIIYQSNLETLGAGTFCQLTPCPDFSMVGSYDRVRTVGDYCFDRSLTSATSAVIHLPNVDRIGYGAFMECNVREIHLGAVTDVPFLAFYGDNDESLRVVSFGGPVTSVGELAFAGRAGLVDLRGVGRLTSVGARAFRNCVRLGMSRFFGAGPGFDLSRLTSLPDQAFYNTAYGWGHTGRLLVDLTSLTSVAPSGESPFGGTSFGAKNLTLRFSEANRQSLEACPVFARDNFLGADPDTSSVEFV